MPPRASYENVTRNAIGKRIHWNGVFIDQLKGNHSKDFEGMRWEAIENNAREGSKGLV